MTMLAYSSPDVWFAYACCVPIALIAFGAGRGLGARRPEARLARFAMLLRGDVAGLNRYIERHRAQSSVSVNRRELVVDLARYTKAFQQLADYAETGG